MLKPRFVIIDHGRLAYLIISRRWRFDRLPASPLASPYLLSADKKVGDLN